jgi:putative phosphotransacetylase
MNTKENRASKPLMANVSNRHIHLCAADCAKLFGAGYTLVTIKDLLQPGEYACKETLTLVGTRGKIDDVRVMWPFRKATQVEISLTDARKIGVPAPVRQSGSLAGSAAVKLIGPAGTLELNEGCIAAKRHVHMATSDAAFYGIRNGELLSIKCPGNRGLIFENVVARVSDTMVLECHLDTDEANAAGLKNGTMVTIL